MCLLLHALGTMASLGSSGCFAMGAGPQVGITFAGRPTVGWEATVDSVDVGQSFVIGGPQGVGTGAPAAGDATSPSKSRGPIARPAWFRRTYVLWEPRVPVVIGADHSFLAGFGASVGMGWDARKMSGPNGETTETQRSFLSGFWTGALDSRPLNSPGCGDNALYGYASIALGIRGDEVYLAPKVGMYAWENICLGTFNFDGE